MLNRHGLVAGATGTGKTKTLQLMAEQLSLMGVPVFAADIRGGLWTGVAGGAWREDHRAAEGIGQRWVPTAYPVELLRLGDAGTGVPVRATVTRSGRLCCRRCSSSTTPRRVPWGWCSTTPTRPGYRCSTSKTCALSSSI